MSSNETTTEYRLGYSRVEQKHGRHITYNEYSTLADATIEAQRQINLDRLGHDGLPVLNRLTVHPFVERRTVTPWAEVADVVGVA